MNGCFAVDRLPDGPQSTSALSEFPMPTPLSESAFDTHFYGYPDTLNGLAVTSLPNGRLQLWIAGSYGIFTCVMLSTDANSKWSAWRQLTDPPVPVPWVQSR